METLRVADEASFKRMLCLERKRSERTAATFLLALVSVEPLVGSREKTTIENIATALATEFRDTDVTGWHQYCSTIGVILTTLNGADHQGITSVISAKIYKVLSQNLQPEQIQQLDVSFYFFPENGENGTGHRKSDEVLYPNIENTDLANKFFAVLKRTTDIVGSLVALILLSPLLLLISAGIKLTSAGPVFFRQKRLGKFGAEFTFLKFRSMYVENDPQIHKEYTRDLIRGTDKTKRVYKIQNDPRVTTFGRILRASSLDELPQFFNVLRGDMSVVGPRPERPRFVEKFLNEVARYNNRHRLKVGITGWAQVNGWRGDTSIRKRVEHDLYYLQNWSFAFDLRIIFLTLFPKYRNRNAY